MYYSGDNLPICDFKRCFPLLSISEYPILRQRWNLRTNIYPCKLDRFFSRDAVTGAITGANMTYVVLFHWARRFLVCSRLFTGGLTI